LSPAFLELAHVVEIHRDQIARYGGSPGIRDQGLLESAVAMPRSGMRGEYFHRDLYEMAAAYLFHIMKNHPFVEGNKRVGALAAFVFLRMNGIDITVTASPFERLIAALVSGAADKTKIAKFFCEHSRDVRRRSS
jgi:death on curing protein